MTAPDQPGSGQPGLGQSGPGQSGPGQPGLGQPGLGQSGPGERRSGLRNPEGAVRGLGAATLGLEAFVLLLGIQPIRVLGGDLSGATIGLFVGIAVVAVVLAGLMRRPWAWHAGTVLQGVLILGGFLHWSLFVLGVIFALVWAYALHVRRVILGPGGGSAAPGV
ncbi:DUF4233 domain-containing protein [Micromonospora sp. NPDC000207]|uniref:DUF4233 domain-containing protein n=1 Tax=Micromonospora sp. NPDC000207 TaxID=3154246 RepID=UPI00332CD74C